VNAPPNTNVARPYFSPDGKSLVYSASGPKIDGSKIYTTSVTKPRGKDLRTSGLPGGWR
jgi:Tol biopolymer transport system component